MDPRLARWQAVLADARRDATQKGTLDFETALLLTELPDDLLADLCTLADELRQQRSGAAAHLCSIISARTGDCHEDCSFCVQSAHHDAECACSPMAGADEIVAAARRAQKAGAHHFCIVTSGGRLDGADFETTLEAVRRITAETDLQRCASLGLLDAGQLARLKEAGLVRYHHNLEACRSFFPQVCTTHSYDDRVAVVQAAKAAGVEVCCGGVLNLGESPRQRIELVFELRDLAPDSIPVNFLSPRPGTPLAGRPLLSAQVAARYIAIFRLVLPSVDIRLAGGRGETFAADPALPFASGANALLIGDLLTTAGPRPEEDVALLESLGFSTGAAAGAEAPPV